MQDFRQLDVWRKAHKLTLLLYKMTVELPSSERYGLVSQVRRATVSVEANIAEGCGRGSSADMARFLQISMGSATEVECLLLITRDLELTGSGQTEVLLNATTEVKRMLASLIKKVRAG